MYGDDLVYRDVENKELIANQDQYLPPDNSSTTDLHLPIVKFQDQDPDLDPDPEQDPDLDRADNILLQLDFLFIMMTRWVKWRYYSIVF